MAKKCLVVILVLMYCLNLFTPLLSLAQVVEGSSFYNQLTDDYNLSGTTYLDGFNYLKDAYNSMLNDSVFNEWMTVEGDYYYLYIPYYRENYNYVGYKVYRFVESDIYIRYTNGLSLRVVSYDSNYYSKYEYKYYFNGNGTNKGSYNWILPSKNNFTVMESFDLTYSPKKFICLTVDELCSLIMTNSPSVKLLGYNSSDGEYKTDEIVLTSGIGLPEEEPPFDDSGIDWSSLFHYYVSTKKTQNNGEQTYEFNNREFIKNIVLYYKFDEFEGMISDGGLVSDYVSYIPSLKYEWIFKDKDGNVSSLETSWGGDGTYGRWLQFDLPFVCDESLGDVESVNSWFIAFLKMEYEYWIKTVLGDGTIQEFNDENSMKDYLDNKVEEIWDKNGYLDYDLKVHVKIDKVDISDGVNIDVMWQDSFSLFYDTDNPNFVDIEDSFYVDTTEDEDKGFIDIVFDNDNKIVDVVDKSDIYDVTKDDKGNVTIINNNGDVIKNYGKDDDGNVVITDKDGNVIDIIENTTTFEAILDNLESSRF